MTFKSRHSFTHIISLYRLLYDSLKRFFHIPAKRESILYRLVNIIVVDIKIKLKNNIQFKIL